MKFNIHIPLLLTFFRLVFSPFVLPALLVALLPLNIFVINALLAIIFVIFSLTDFLDGYLARRYNQETILGKILDPIADKFLLYSTLIALVTVDRMFFYWAIIFIGREFFMMAIRLVALEHGFSVPVSWLGKSKTFSQAAYITIAIMNDSVTKYEFTKFNLLEYLLLFIALNISIISAWAYYCSFIKQLPQRNIIEYQ